MCAIPETLYGRKSEAVHNDAWGNLISSSSTLGFEFNYNFIGALGCRADATTGLIYMRQRWYDPTIQRFISRDPLGLGAGQNPYSYCKNAPTNYVDPTGLYVDATYNLATKTLTVQNYRQDQNGNWVASGTPLVVNNVFSGNGNPADSAVAGGGPIPPGQYWIADQGLTSKYDINTWFATLNPDTGTSDVWTTDPLTGKTVHRDRMRIHPGGSSAGCITVPKRQFRDWRLLENMIINTGTVTVYPPHFPTPVTSSSTRSYQFDFQIPIQIKGYLRVVY